MKRRGHRGKRSAFLNPSMAYQKGECLYWVIYRSAPTAEVYARDSATASATESRRSGLSDFLEAFFARIEDNGSNAHSSIPSNFNVPDNTRASLVNCALNLDEDTLMDADYVKHFRQRERER